MELIEFINLIKPEHIRTTCSDENISNGFYVDSETGIINTKYRPRCERCALLEIANGTINIELNRQAIEELL
jgi:hypothetical protein